MIPAPGSVCRVPGWVKGLPAPGTALGVDLEARPRLGTGPLLALATTPDRVWVLVSSGRVTAWVAAGNLRVLGARS